LLHDLVRRTKARAQRPLMVKLSPNVTNIGFMAHVAADAGADAVSLVNTFLALSIDVETRRPRIANVTGGLSGPAIKPIAVRMVHEVAKAVKIPIVGMGGIVRAEDAVEFMLAGATAVQVGTASYADPRAVENIANGLKRWCAGHEVAEVRSLTGGLQL
jgi:dihydroorotate dehydrogenase (NAD+) catalytic subunit